MCSCPFIHQTITNVVVHRTVCTFRSEKKATVWLPFRSDFNGEISFKVERSKGINL